MVSLFVVPPMDCAHAHSTATPTSPFPYVFFPNYDVDHLAASAQNSSTVLMQAGVTIGNLLWHAPQTPVT